MSDKKPRCAKCGRVLTSPASIARGIGPECAGLSGGKGPARPAHGNRRGPVGWYDAGETGASGGNDPIEVHENIVAENAADDTKSNEKAGEEHG